MDNRFARRTDKRVPVAFGLMAFVLALLGSQHMTRNEGRLESGQPGGTTFVTASTTSR